MLVNLPLQSLVRLFRNMRENDHGFYEQLGWDMAATLQLQRLIYQSQGLGTWHGEPNVVHVTANGDRFGIPKWMGVVDGGRISPGGKSAFEKADSPLLEGEGGTGD